MVDRYLDNGGHTLTDGIGDGDSFKVGAWRRVTCRDKFEGLRRSNRSGIGDLVNAKERR